MGKTGQVQLKEVSNDVKHNNNSGSELKEYVKWLHDEPWHVTPRSRVLAILLAC